jgi:hypothetical protein
MRHKPKIATLSKLENHTTEDPRTGAVRSLQTTDMTLPEQALLELWTPSHLERLARTYWHFLARFTLGLVRVVYSESGRSVVLLARPLKLLIFAAPEYELDADRGLVRWRIRGGLLVARSGRSADADDTTGHLQIEVRRLPDRNPGEAKLHVEIEVANFHPAIAFGLGQRVYNATQARIHLFVTNGFLRSLARLDLAESRVGAFSVPHR